MNVPLAEILDGVKPGQLGALAFSGLVVMAVWMKMNAFEKAFAERMKLLMQVQSQPEKHEISPQPFVVKREEVHASLDSLEKHLVADDNEHKRIHIRVDHVRDGLTELSREVSAVQATLELNGARLAQMDGKIDRILERRNQ